MLKLSTSRQQNLVATAIAPWSSQVRDIQTRDARLTRRHAGSNKAAPGGHAGFSPRSGRASLGYRKMEDAPFFARTGVHSGGSRFSPA